MTKKNETTATKDDIIKALQQVYDPEIPVNIYDLGLIYNVEIDKDVNVNIEMTLTTPGCPVAQTFPTMVSQAVKEHVENINEVYVMIVWDPPWSQDMMSDAAKLQLGLL